MRVWVYFVAVSILLPGLHGVLLLGASVDPRLIALFVFYEGALWISCVAIYLMEAYRTRILGHLGLTTAGARLAAAGAGTALVTLWISPLTMGEIGTAATFLLGASGALLGAGAGTVYWYLTSAPDS